MSAALYGSFRPVPSIFLEAVLGYAALSFDNTRFVTETGGFAQGERDGEQVFGSLGGGYSFQGPWRSPPMPASTSPGPGSTPIRRKAETNLRCTTTRRNGARSPRCWAQGGIRPRDGLGLLVPNLRAEWRQDLSGSEDAEIAYADALSETFAVESDAASESSVLFGLGLDALRPGFSLASPTKPRSARTPDPDQFIPCA